ncbi:MAG: LemA family protein [Euryarchaeota archaeon]|nr:LemA family protein [Euryarchaeota archaeon]
MAGELELVIGLVLLLMVVLFVGLFFSIYNSLVRLRNNIDKAWSNIDVLLKQRHDELTKLLATVKGYRDYEKEVLVKVTEARTAFMNAKSVPEKAAADNIMTSTLKTLFAVAENYPQLKADTSFVNFQHRVSEVEDQIADRREFYNDSVNTYNIRIQSVPDMFVASMLHYTKQDLFKVAETDRADVTVQF